MTLMEQQKQEAMSSGNVQLQPTWFYRLVALDTSQAKLFTIVFQSPLCSQCFRWTARTQIAPPSSTFPGIERRPGQWQWATTTEPRQESAEGSQTTTDGPQKAVNRRHSSTTGAPDFGRHWSETATASRPSRPPRLPQTWVTFRCYPAGAQRPHGSQVTWDIR